MEWLFYFNPVWLRPLRKRRFLKLEKNKNVATKLEGDEVFNGWATKKKYFFVKKNYLSKIN